MVSAGDLGRIGLLSGLDAAAQRRLLDAATTSTYGDGQVVLLEGDAGAPVYFLLDGTVRVYRTNLDGREQNLIYLRAGEGLNIPSAFDDEGRAPASAIAVGDVTLLAIERLAFRRIVAETPELALATLRDFTQRLHHLTELTHDLGLRTVRGRLARFLLTHVQAEGASPVRWTHQEIANQIGTVREVVSRTLRAFVKEGLVEMQRHRVVVRDRESLARECEL